MFTGCEQAVLSEGQHNLGCSHLWVLSDGSPGAINYSRLNTIDPTLLHTTQIISRMFSTLQTSVNSHLHCSWISSFWTQAEVPQEESKCSIIYQDFQISFQLVVTKRSQFVVQLVCCLFTLNSLLLFLPLALQLLWFSTYIQNAHVDIK